MSQPVRDRIHDAVASSLSTGDDGGRIVPVLAFEDHWLRRFGRVDFATLQPGETFRGLRRQADEVWALVAGEATFELEDQREGSPTQGAREVHRLTASARILVPFGVSLEIRAHAPAHFVRLMTHSEGEDPPADRGT